ncbi:MAG: ABC transporter ATP-binding protein [Thermoleophilia bacterium]|nr:ABC transporter ATP-binding protein [Thermoleophilia bacterium]
MDNALTVTNVRKIYGNRANITTALDDVSLEVADGDFVGIMGPSGSGKTTLLNCISTIDRVTAGHVMVGGDDVTRLKGDALARLRRERLGFIFQDFNLLDTLTGFDNIALALTISRIDHVEIDRRVEQAARRLGISSVLQKYPYQMSGGERQRVASARAIVTDPTLVLADEPTGALDSGSARVLLESFERLNLELGATILMVTHNPSAASYCRRILFIKDGRLFAEIARDGDDRKAFFGRIMEVVTLLGGDTDAR